MKRRTFDFRNDAPMRRSADAAKWGNLTFQGYLEKRLQEC